MKDYTQGERVEIRRFDLANHSNSKVYQLYNETNFDLKVKITLTGNRVTKMDFTLTTSGTIYEICDIKKCRSNGATTDPHYKNYYVIHISKRGTTSPSSKSLTSSLPSLTTGRFATFLFKVYDNGCPTTFDCSLPDAQPKTKKGAIIVSI